MTCALHDWYFDSACPKCAGPVTATVIEDYKPEDPLPDVDDPHRLGIPRWLMRNRDGSFKYPGYPDDPVQSAERRKAEYALDEKKEQGHDTTVGVHADNLPRVPDLSD